MVKILCWCPPALGKTRTPPRLGHYQLLPSLEEEQGRSPSQWTAGWGKKIVRDHEGYINSVPVMVREWRQRAEDKLAGGPRL